MRMRRSLILCFVAALLIACAKAPPPVPVPAAQSPAPAAVPATAPPAPAPSNTPATASNNVSADTSATDDGSDYRIQKHKPDAQGYTELDWLAMMPHDELESLKEAAGTIVHTGKKRMKQFGSYRIVPDVLSHKIKLPGYVVPIESDDKGRMTEFFFVPFFGACIHVPPPPPNQIVYARLSKPIKAPEIWEAYMLKGELREEKILNLTASSAYSMNDATLEPYKG